MNSSNPRLSGLWVAKFPGQQADPTPCLACGRVVPSREKLYRLRPDRGIEPYGREQVVGYLCRTCRLALGPLHRASYFNRIEGVETK